MPCESLEHAPVKSSAASPLLDVMRHPGTQQIFVHDYRAQNVRTVETIKGTSCDFRAERALVMASTDDLVVLNHAPDPQFLAYLETLEVGPKRDAILDLQSQGSIRGPSSVSTLSDLATDLALADRTAALVAERLQPNTSMRLSAYFSSAALVGFRNALARHTGRDVSIESGSPAAVELANDKGRMRSEALRLGIPCAPGSQVVHGPDASVDMRVEAITGVAERWLPLTGQVIVRATWSSSGADVHLIDTPLDRSALHEWVSRRAHVDSCLVDARLPLVSSPNALVWVGETGKPTLVAFTGQRLNNASKHIGNYYPFESNVLKDMETAAIRLAEALGCRDYRGMLGIDLLELSGNDSRLPGFAFAETNGRMNASSYATALFETVNERRARLGRHRCCAWLSQCDAPVGVRNFAMLEERLGDLLYQHHRAAGIIPYNSGLLRFGWVDLLTVAGDLESARQIECEALERMR